MKKKSNKNGIKHFTPLKDTLSKYMLRKTASYYEYDELKSLFQRVGEEGFKKYFSECTNGKPKITKNTLILNSIVDHFKNM